MDEGHANGHVGSPDAETQVKKMSIPEIKIWLTEHGQEAVVYELGKEKAKKADYVKAFLSAQA